MKKLICLLMCLVLLISCVPAATAASLTPESVFGTWSLYKYVSGTETYTAADLKQAGLSLTFHFHADGTGKLSVKTGDDSGSENISWKVKSNKVVIEETVYLKSSGGDLLLISESDKFYFKKTKETSGKTTTKAITSTGTYKLNNSKKTASLTIVANRNVTSLVIPDTIKANGKTYKVTEIGAKACANMKKLTTLTIGKNVKTIGATAFTGDKKLKKIIINSTFLGKVGSKAFSDVKSSGTVTCPKKKVSKYQTLLQKGGLPKKFKVKGK